MTRALPSRALLRKLHLWMALAIGLPVAFVSALGLPVTYWGESDALFDATFYGVGRTHAASQVDFDRLGAAALAVSHAVQLKGISLERDGRTVIATVASSGKVDLEVSLDPATGHVVGVRDPQQSMIFVLYSLHTRLLLDRLGLDAVGRAILMALAAGMIGLIVSGVLLWWPRRWRWESLLPVVRRRTLWRDLHNVAGLYTLVPLVLAALTALLLSVPATRSLGSPVPPPMPSRFSAGRGEITLDRAARTGEALSPGRATIGVFDIDTPDHLIVLTTSKRAGDRWIVVDRHDGRPVSVSDLRPQTPADGADPGFLIGLHQGHRFGPWGQALFALASMAPTLVFATGLWLWLRRRRFVSDRSLRKRAYGRP